MAALVTSFADTESYYSGLKNRQRLKYTMQQMLSCRSSCSAAMIAPGKESRSPKITGTCYGVTSKKRGILMDMDLDASEAKKPRVAYESTNGRRDCSTLITSGEESIEINELGITTPEVRHEGERSKRLPVIGTSKRGSVKSHTVECEPKMKRLDGQNMKKTRSVVPNDSSRKSEQCLLSQKNILKEGKCQERHGLDSQNMEKTRSIVPRDCLGRSKVKECVLSKKEILKEEKCHDRHGCGAISVKTLSSRAQIADRQDDSERLANDITCQRNRKSDLYFADIRGQKLGDKHGCSSSTTINRKPVSSPRDRSCTSDSLTIDGRGQLRSKSVSQSNSNGSISSDNQMQQSSHSATGSICEQKEGNVAITNGTQLSDTRALRCEWLKKRFGDTILRAQHKIQECNGEKVDHVKLQQEKEILEKKTRDAEAAAEAERKLQREKKREAARIALRKMESTVEFDDHVTTMKDFAVLIGYTQVYESCEQHVLERFGLFFTPSNRN